MNTRIVSAIVLTIALSLTARAQVPGIINYQGRITTGGTNFTGTGAFKFALVNGAGNVSYWSQNGHSVGGGEPTGVPFSVPLLVTNGLYSVLLGDTTIPGMTVAIPVSVFTNLDVRLRVWFSSGSGFQQLAPDQRIGAAGYAMVAGNGWQLSGNGGTTAGTNFLGTIDNQPLELKVNGTRGWRLEPNAASAPNVIGGSPANFVAGGVVGATIGGGGALNYSGLGFTNSVWADFSTIGGGDVNTISVGANGSVIGGGGFNLIFTGDLGCTIAGGGFNSILLNATGATVGGGSFNQIQDGSGNATIGGGTGNNISTNSYNSTISGGITNTIQSSATDATIGGGAGNQILSYADRSTIAGGYNNLIFSSAGYSSIAGGYNGVIYPSAFESHIGGGVHNQIETLSYGGVIGGGQQNAIGFDCADSFIGGGLGNLVRFGFATTIAGGRENTAGYDVDETGNYAAVGGGYQNTAQGDYSTVPGGSQNWAPGAYSFAAGRRAKADADGSFVWADSQDSDFFTFAANEFAIRASGGLRLNASTSLYCDAPHRQALNLYGTDYGVGSQSLRTYFRTELGTPPNGGGFAWFAGGIHSPTTDDPGPGGVNLMSLTYIGHAGCIGDPNNYDLRSRLLVHGELAVEGPITTCYVFETSSDRNKKENIETVDSKSILDKVSAIPITTWNFIGQDQRHLGPMAQDFKAAFDLGGDDKHIATVDEGGVALAAVQGLYQIVKEKDAHIAALEKRLAQLESRMEKVSEQVEESRTAATTVANVHNHGGL